MTRTRLAVAVAAFDLLAGIVAGAWGSWELRAYEIAGVAPPALLWAVLGFAPAACTRGLAELRAALLGSASP